MCLGFVLKLEMAYQVPYRDTAMSQHLWKNTVRHQPGNGIGFQKIDITVGRHDVVEPAHMSKAQVVEECARHLFKLRCLSSVVLQQQLFNLSSTVLFVMPEKTTRGIDTHRWKHNDLVILPDATY